MRFNKALFVTPYSPGRYFGGVRPPVGITYVEEFVASCGVQTMAMDMNLGHSFKDLIKLIKANKPDIIGFTIMTYQYLHTLKMITDLKKKFSEISIIAGGAHVCALEKTVLELCPSIDYAVIGEGEYPMRDLCCGEPFELIPGLLYKKNETVFSGPKRQFISNLNTLPFPKYKSYPLENYVGEIEIVTSRGCPHSCTFCAVSTIMGKITRCRNIDSIIDELNFFYKKGIRAFELGDDNLLANRTHCLNLLHAIQNCNFKNVVFRCGQGIRADLVDEEILIEMKKTGIKHIGIGVESANNRVLKVIKKNETIEEIENAIDIACKHKFDISLFFIVGSPTETLQDINKSIELAIKYPVMKAFFFNLIPFPGTEIYEWISENKLFLGSYDKLINRKDELKLRSKPFFKTPEMSNEDRIYAIKLTEKISKQIQINTLKRKFTSLGFWGILFAQAGRFDIMERFFIKSRNLRNILDHIIFSKGNIK